MKFIDQIEIFVKAGHGGRGIVSFKRARNMPKLGADGGDGGKGGSVYFEASHNINTLSSLRYHQNYAAENGERGGSNNCTGASGNDLIIKVPQGTQIYDSNTNLVLGELTTSGERYLIAQGGKGGFGNQRFLRPTHQRPEESTKGLPGEERGIRLELKLLADVGLCGFPNAGKSTLLSVLSAARPKIADYPFTTLHPHLGVVETDQDLGKSFVLADIPGLIEGASEGKGLGHEFLKHLERTRIIAFLVSLNFYDADEIIYNFVTLRDELSAFSADFLKKKFVVVLSKRDILPDNEKTEAFIKELEQQFTDLELPFFVISSATGLGLRELKMQLYDEVQKLKTVDQSLTVDRSGPVIANDPWFNPLDQYQMVTDATKNPLSPN